jgi:glutamate synthase (NADPH/NADH) large chain
MTLLQQHICATNSKKAKQILATWQDARSRFVKVFPVEYKQLLAKIAQIQD